jgi:hypothetical protein
MGNSGIAYQSLYSISNNPAGIVGLQQCQIGAAYQSHFLTTEIQSQAAYAALPLASSHAIGFGVNSYGLKDVSNFLTIRGIYGKRFGSTFATAIGVNYHRFYVRNYHNEQTASLDLGFQYYASDKLAFGLLARNVTLSVFMDDTPQYIAKEFAVGFCYSLSGQLQISSDLYYDIHEYFNFRSGLAYWFDPRLCVRAGAASDPTQYFGGVGFLIKKIQIDMASSFHPRLGSSLQLALSYGF